MTDNKPTSREEALQWLVANVDEWPIATNTKIELPFRGYSWMWTHFDGEDKKVAVVGFSAQGQTEFITRANWLEAQSEQEEDAEEFAEFEEMLAANQGYVPTEAHVAAVKTLCDLGYVYVGGEKWISEDDRRRDEAIAAMDKASKGIGDVFPKVLTDIYQAIAAGRIPGIVLEGNEHGADR